MRSEVAVGFIVMLALGRLERQAAAHTYLRPCLSELATGWTHIPWHILSRLKNGLELHTHIAS